MSRGVFCVYRATPTVNSIISLLSINRFVFVINTDCVICDVETEVLRRYNAYERQPWKDLIFIFLTCGIDMFQFGYLTLRPLMSYIYIYMEHQFLMFLDHTQRRSTVGRTPLDE